VRLRQEQARRVAEDVEHGFVDGLRSLLIPRASVLIGRGLADVALMAWALAIATGLGFAVGFRPGGSAAGILAAFGLCLEFGLAFEWVFITGGLVAGNAQAAQSITGLAVTPLVFLSSAYVPVQSIPSGIKQFSEVQPVTPMADAVRSLLTGDAGRALVEHSTSYYVGLSLLWAAAIFAVFGFLAVVRFARR
jgi:ABC-2 type transport system permease protein